MNKQTFGERLKSRRKYMGLTQDELATKVTEIMQRIVREDGMNVENQQLGKSSISHLENDRNDPSLLALRALSEALECSFNWLVRGDDGKGEWVESIAYWAAKIPESKQKLLENVARDFFNSTQS